MSETFHPDNLHAGSQKKIVQSPAIIKQGQVIQRGQLLGRITATGKLTEAVGSHNDGTEDAYAIAVEDVDATLGDVKTTVYTEGEFNRLQVIYSYGDDYADWEVSCKAVGIYLRDAVPAGPATF